MKLAAYRERSADHEGEKSMTQKEEDDLVRRVRESGSLADRLKDCVTRIGEMCSNLHPPKMSIPVHWNDDDIFIITTLQDAMAAELRVNNDSANAQAKSG